MSKELPEISPELSEWISAQQVFFVGSAPLSGDGRVNISPKGGDSFRILGPHEVVYQDYTGSGAETAAHVRENGRIVIMFCAFTGPPKIVRLHGDATLITSGHESFNRFLDLFPENAGTRAFFHVNVTRVSDSCGYSIPFYDYQGPRETLDKWSSKRTPEQMEEYRREKNHQSIDGLSAFAPEP